MNPNIRTLLGPGVRFVWDLAIILSGGGMRCAYAIGVLMALIEVHGIMPGIISGLSGSLAPIIYFLLGRFKEMRDWPNQIKDKKFINFWRLLRVRIPIDVPYAVDRWMADAPELAEAIATSRTKLILPATVLPEKSGDPETRCWFRNEDFRNHARELMIALQSTSQSVRVGKRNCADACFTTSLTDLMAEVLREGANQVVVVDNSVSPVSRWTAPIMRVLARGEGPMGKLAWKFRHEEPIIPKSSTVHVLRRRQDLPVEHMMDNEPEHYWQSIMMGYRDCAELDLSHLK